MAVKFGLILTLIYLAVEYVRIYFAPVLSVDGDTARDFVNAYLQMTPRQIVSLLAVNLLAILIQGPLMGSFSAYFLQITASSPPHTANAGQEGVKQEKVSQHLLWFVDSKRRMKAIQLRFVIVLLKLFWQAVFCAFPLYLLYQLEGSETSVSFMSQVLMYSTALLIGLLFAYVKSGSYYAAYFLMAQDVEYKMSALIRDSAAIMRGHLWEFFAYQLSFIPWYFMVLPTFGIALTYLVPYRGVCDASFIRKIDSTASSDIHQ